MHKAIYEAILQSADLENYVSSGGLAKDGWLHSSSTIYL